MLTNCSRSKLNLINQIEAHKNYYQHRKRLGTTKCKSPITLKKSLSFDQQKSMFFNDFKNRKLYTNQFHKKQQNKEHEERDAKMLRNIFSYERKLFVFSLNPNQPTSNLHHNSRINHYKNTMKIDHQNEKIHFRIKKAKSNYSMRKIQSSRQSPSVKAFFQKTYNSFGKINPNVRNSYKKLKTENQEQEDFSKQDYTFSNFEKFKSNIYRPDNSANYKNSEPSRLNQSRPFKFLSTSNDTACDRIRRERLASKLYEKKVKFQNTISSRWHRKA